MAIYMNDQFGLPSFKLFIFMCLRNLESMLVAYVGGKSSCVTIQSAQQINAIPFSVQQLLCGLEAGNPPEVEAVFEQDGSLKALTQHR